MELAIREMWDVKEHMSWLEHSELVTDVKFIEKAQQKIKDFEEKALVQFQDQEPTNVTFFQHYMVLKGPDAMTRVLEEPDSYPFKIIVTAFKGAVTFSAKKPVRPAMFTRQGFGRSMDLSLD